MLDMEAKVLQALEYRIASTTCYGFVSRFSAAGSLSDSETSLVKVCVCCGSVAAWVESCRSLLRLSPCLQYLCDFAVLYYRMLKYRPSMIVASAVYLARVMSGASEPWTPTLHHFTKYNAWELHACVLELSRLQRAEATVVAGQRDKVKAVSEKYLADKFHAASAVAPVDEAVLDKSFLQFDRPAGMAKPASSRA